MTGPGMAGSGMTEFGATGFSWTPGPGWAVVTPGFAAWLPPTTARSVVLALHATSGAAEARLLLAGQAEGWALVMAGPPPAVHQERVSVAALDADGRPVPSERAVTLRLGAPPAPGAQRWPVERGVVACGALVWRAVDARADGQPSLRPEAGSGVPPEKAPGLPPAARGAAPRVTEVPSPAIILAPTDVPGLITEVPWAAPGSDEESVANPFAELWGHTIRRPVEAAAVRDVRNADLEIETNPHPVAPAPPAAPVPEPVEGSRDPVPPAPRSAPDSPTAEPPADPRGPMPPRSTTATLIATLLDEEEPVGDDHGDAVTGDGRRAPLSGALVIGRAPQPVPGFECRLLRIASPERTVSRSHVLIVGECGTVRLKDLGSNNGTVLVRHGRRLPVGPEGWTTAADGDVVDLGEQVTVLLVGLP